MDNNLKHSVQFITDTTNGKTGFSTPPNYLESLEDKILATTFKERLPQENSFKVPDDYFNSLEDKILSKVTSERKETKVIPLRKRILQLAPLAAAASILLFIGLNYFSTTNTVTFDNITSTDVDTWLVNNSEVVSSELTEMFDASDFEGDIFSETSFADADLENYLTTVDDTTILYNEIP